MRCGTRAPGGSDTAAHFRHDGRDGDGEEGRLALGVETVDCLEQSGSRGTWSELDNGWFVRSDADGRRLERSSGVCRRAVADLCVEESGEWSAPRAEREGLRVGTKRPGRSEDSAAAADDSPAARDAPYLRSSEFELPHTTTPFAVATSCGCRGQGQWSEGSAVIGDPALDSTLAVVVPGRWEPVTGYSQDRPDMSDGDRRRRRPDPAFGRRLVGSVEPTPARAASRKAVTSTAMAEGNDPLVASDGAVR